MKVPVFYPVAGKTLFIEKGSPGEWRGDAEK